MIHFILGPSYPYYPPTSSYQSSFPNTGAFIPSYPPPTSTSPFYHPYPTTSYTVYNPPISLPGTVAPSQTTLPPPHLRSVSSDRRTERLKGGEEKQQPNEAGGGLQPSRSVGDIISELQKEAEALAARRSTATSPAANQGSRPASRGATG